MPSALHSLFEDTEELNREEILALAPPGPTPRLLDLGCADGAFTRRLAERSRAQEVCGVEVFAAAADEARGRGIEVVGADLDQGLPYPDASFDLVHANQVIEHVDDTDLFLREIHRVLRPTGCAIVSTNNLASWHNVLALVLGHQPMPAHASDEVILGNPLNPMHGDRHPHRARAHRRLFARRGLLELCVYHGFRVEPRTVGYYPFPPPLARVLARVDPWHGCYLTFRLRRAP